MQEMPSCRMSFKYNRQKTDSVFDKTFETGSFFRLLVRKMSDI